MVGIKYTKHLELRLKIRKIPYEYPKLIFEQPDKEFIDVLEKKNVAIKRLISNKKVRNMMVVYEIQGNIAEIVTIHPISSEKITNRLMSGRWK